MSINSELSEITQLLHQDNYSCVVRNSVETQTFSRQGVQDLLSLYEERPEFLCNALVADKVVGKGAAALMILGKVAGVYAAVISKPALDLLTEHNMNVKYDTLVPNIINRTHTGVCPVEQLCLPLSSLSDMYNAISHFVHK
ncbi:MAG: DUF1893 domain-containing protein [Bacteroidaceae bacterium]|nr:DUF1893 domain-containing protein [Bacteroidaceae bacterium]